MQMANQTCRYTYTCEFPTLQIDVLWTIYTYTDFERWKSEQYVFFAIY